MAAEAPTNTSTGSAGSSPAPVDYYKGLDGPFGLRITAARVQPNLTAPYFETALSYYTQTPKVQLPNPKIAASQLKITPGGALKDLPTRAFPVGTADRAIGFDADQNGSLDSFFLSKATFKVIQPLSVAGLKLEGVTVVLNELTNHPRVATLLNQPSGSWNGSMNFSGTKVSIPSIPQLSMTPLRQGTDAWRASYGLSSGELILRLSKASYTSSRLQLALTDTELKVSNTGKNVSFNGSGQFSLPELGLKNLSGSLSLNVVNKALSSIAASLDVPAASPVTNLGISGRLEFSHNNTTKTGNITIKNGVVAGIGVSGKLDYTASGSRATDQITGQLSFDNRQQQAALTIDAFDKDLLSLVPLAGTIDFLYAPQGSATPGGHLNFTGLEFDLITGLSTTKASFSGNLKLNLDATGKPSIAELDLTLKNPVSLDLGSLGTVSAEPAADGTPVKFSLQQPKPNDTTTTGLVPTLTGKFSYVLGGRSLTTNGIVYEFDPDFNSYSWVILDSALTL